MVIFNTLFNQNKNYDIKIIITSNIANHIAIAISEKSATINFFFCVFIKIMHAKWELFIFWCELLVVVLSSSRCSTLPHSHLCSWRTYCGVRWPLLSTQPNQRPCQSNPGPRRSTWSSWLRGPRHSETLCRADGLYGWSTTSKMEAHCYCGQPQRWDNIGPLVWYFFFSPFSSCIVILSYSLHN